MELSVIFLEFSFEGHVCACTCLCGSSCNKYQRNDDVLAKLKMERFQQGGQKWVMREHFQTHSSSHGLSVRAFAPPLTICAACRGAFPLGCQVPCLFQKSGSLALWSFEEYSLPSKLCSIFLVVIHHQNSILPPNANFTSCLFPSRLLLRTLVFLSICVDNVPA